MSSDIIKSYKGFDKDLCCRGFQYEVGKEYEIEGEIKYCQKGFHACESPFEVFDHYDMLTSRFCEVEQSGKIDREDDESTKVCSSKIKVKAELKLADLINIGVEWLKEVTSPNKIKDADTNSSGISAKIGSSGDYAKIGSTGISAQIGSSGEDSVIMCSGLGSVVKAKVGSWITLAEWEYNKDKGRHVPKCVKTEFVDGERIKGDTWYKLKDGEFKEVEEP